MSTTKEESIPAVINAIDWKYKIKAFNPCSLNCHDETDSVLFLAHDAALPAAIERYKEKSIELGANPAHIQAIELLLSRVLNYQETINKKTPDADLPCEIERCVDGVGVSTSQVQHHHV